MAERLVAAIRTHGQKPLDKIVTHEFGVGATLTTAMTFHAMGINHQTLVDVYPLAKPWILEQTVEQFHRLLSHRSLRLPSLPLSNMGIEYVAPGPVVSHRGPYDVVTSTSVLEHLSERELSAIFSGLRRMLKPTGIMVHHIDYTDHYSHGYEEISCYNFLKYSDRRWAWFNSPLHFQNRLRHSDYLRLIEKAGFEIVAVETNQCPSKDLEVLTSMHLDPRFHRYTTEDLSISHGFIVARS